MRLRRRALVTVLGVAAILASVPARANEKFIQKMIKQLTRDRDARARAEAAETLGRFRAPAGVPALAGALADFDNVVRREAARALWEMHAVPEAKSAIPALEAALRDPDVDVLINVTGALRSLDADPSVYVPVLRRIRDQADGCADRMYAAKGLWGYGPPAEQFPAALRCLASADTGVQRDASAVLRRVLAKPDPALALPVLEALETARGGGRVRYAALLGEFKSATPEALPGLTRLLADADAQNRQTAALLLGRLQSAGRPAVPLLAELLAKDPSERVRLAAAGALGDIAAAARDAAPALQKAAASDAAPAVREAAQKALVIVEAKK